MSSLGSEVIEAMTSSQHRSYRCRGGGTSPDRLVVAPGLTGGDACSREGLAGPCPGLTVAHAWRVATFLLLLCIAAGCGVIGILWMLFGPTSAGIARPRASYAGPAVGVSFAPPPYLPDAHPEPSPPSGARSSGFEPFAAPSRFEAPHPGRFEQQAFALAPTEIAPVPPRPAPAASNDFSFEEPVRELRVRAKSPSPPPLPPVTPLPPPPLPKTAIAPTRTIVRAEGTPTSPPRLGVSAPSARRHLEPPRRMPAPLARSRAARGSDAPPVSAFATDSQRTVSRELDAFSTAEHTFVD